MHHCPDCGEPCFCDFDDTDYGEKYCDSHECRNYEYDNKPDDYDPDDPDNLDNLFYLQSMKIVDHEKRLKKLEGGDRLE